jgi:hypothetical protein
MISTRSITSADRVLYSLLSVQSPEKRIMSDATRCFAIIANALDAALAYFADRMDCDDGVPNEAMNLHTEIEQAQAALEAMRKTSCPACDDQPLVMR